MESFLWPIDTREGETERVCLCTLAALGAGMGSTSGWDGDRERWGERGEMRAKSSSTVSTPPPPVE